MLRWRCWGGAWRGVVGRRGGSTESQSNEPRRAPSVAAAAGRESESQSKAKPRKIVLSQSLPATAQARKVPASRLNRVANFGGLAASLGLNAATRYTKRVLGLTSALPADQAESSRLFDRHDAEQIVRTLCKVRGAALKLGQMLSLQDNSMVSNELHEIFERVRHGADFMPASQTRTVLAQELGADWQSLFSEFDERPFAAASIGQVHRAVLKQAGAEVAVKIQYPGVAESIDSDIENLLAVVRLAALLPPALHLDNTMRVARDELAWEVNYLREAAAAQRFRDLLTNDPCFYVPQVFAGLSTRRVLITELVAGSPVDQAVALDQPTRDWIASNVLRLTLDELFIHRVMQTDPNWSNFFYDRHSHVINLLDFGATRDFDKPFVDIYLHLILAAARGDRDGVHEASVRLKFLTGHETKTMRDAHIDAVMILGEAFAPQSSASGRGFDFATQDTTARLHKLIGIMLRERLCPPPDQSYSLHRKMSGAFLLATKLSARVDCRQLLEDLLRKLPPTSSDQ